MAIFRSLGDQAGDRVTEVPDTGSRPAELFDAGFQAILTELPRCRFEDIDTPRADRGR